MLRALHFIVAASVAAPLLCGAQNGAGEVFAWESARPLTWSDFRGPIDATASADTVAMTAASLSWKYAYRMESGRRDCTYRLTEISTQATFDPSQSWARMEHRTPTVLEHEQGHFDLTEVFRRMLAAEGAELVDAPHQCRPNARQTDVEARVAALVEPLRDRIWDELQRVQTAYDDETRHGIDTAVQREWTARIAEALRRGHWR
jgi:hypothetical protein